MVLSSNLTLFIDLGSSLIKVCYLHEDKPFIFLMPPHLSVITEKRLKAIVDANEASSPEDIAWLQMGDDLIAVGNLAEQLNGGTAIKQRKSEQGLYRVLGVLGILQETLDLPDRFTCNLGVALPVAEYADREAFADLVREEAAQFAFRGHALGVSFNILDVQVEGMGLVRDRRAELLSQNKSANQLKIVALMFGHRNLSVLTFSGSTLQLESCTSSGPGFVKAVEVLARELSVEPTTSGLTEIVALGKQSFRFEGSLRPRDTSTAVAEARSEYWTMVENHLQNALPGGEFEVVAAGGALPVIKHQLQNFFDEVGLGDRLSFAEKLQANLLKALSVEPATKAKLTSDPVLPIRLLDAFVGMQTLVLKSRQPQQAPAKAGKTLKVQASPQPVPSAATTGDAVIDRLRGIL